MEDAIGLIIPIVFVLLFLGLGLFAGGWLERSHIKSLDRRDLENQDFLITQLKTCPNASEHGPPPKMFVGEAIISSDYLKTFVSSIKKFFGGELRSYQTMLSRARREALQRIIAQAKAEGYNAICNVRMQTADVGGSSGAIGGNKTLIMAAILASATAYHAKEPQPSA